MDGINTKKIARIQNCIYHPRTRKMKRDANIMRNCDESMGNTGSAILIL